MFIPVKNSCFSGGFTKIHYLNDVHKKSLLFSWPAFEPFMNGCTREIILLFLFQKTTCFLAISLVKHRWLYKYDCIDFMRTAYHCCYTVFSSGPITLKYWWKRSALWGRDWYFHYLFREIFISQSIIWSKPMNIIQTHLYNVFFSMYAITKQ